MASKSGEKRQREEDVENVENKKQKGEMGEAVKKRTIALVRKLFNEKDREKREQNIATIAQMVVARNDKQSQINKLAEMVKKTKTLYKGKRSYNIEDRDLIELAALVQSHTNVTVPTKAFSVRQIRTHQRFGYTEYI
ncbi:Hypothetical predicted protein [Paramuricea clavata]|uniref:Uncharacterized protein n=1 Tax=Paramuricea clavata TaxID=317549 RepID=A0A6S7FT38_PARCT|nr:Hypothetical predicted protein [Paramuricea clavata]